MNKGKLISEIERLEQDVKKSNEIIKSTSSQFAKKDQYKHICKINKKLNRLYAIRRQIYGY